jgi:uncharacterized protein DUF4345
MSETLASPQTERILRTGLVIAGVVNLALAAVMILAPGTFFDEFAGYGTENDHYIRDMGTTYLGLGVALLLAAPRPSWRAPVLWLAAIGTAAHAVNHLVDVGDSIEDWVGPVNLALVALSAALYAWLAVLAGRVTR